MQLKIIEIVFITVLLQMVCTCGYAESFPRNLHDSVEHNLVTSVLEDALDLGMFSMGLVILRQTDYTH